MANDPLSEVIRRATYAADGMSQFCRASDQMRPGDLRRLLAAAQAYSCPCCNGRNEVDSDGATRADWEELPESAKSAYRMGLVKFGPCPSCAKLRREADGEAPPC